MDISGSFSTDCLLPRALLSPNSVIEDMDFNFRCEFPTIISSQYRAKSAEILD